MEGEGMKKAIQSNFAAVSLVAASLVMASTALAEHTRVTYPGIVSAEAFGKGLTYSVQFDRAVSDDLSAGVGIGSTGLDFVSGGDTGKKATLVPVYAHYYFTRDHGSLYAMGGATLIASSGTEGLKSKMGNFEFPSGSVLPVAGLGFEERTDTGFLFRATGYGMMGKKLTPWFGFTFGYGF